LWGIAYLKTAYVSDKQRHLTRLKVFTKVLNQDFNGFQFTRLNNVLAHGLDSLGGYHHIPDLSLQLQEKPEVQIDQKIGARPSRIKEYQRLNGRSCKRYLKICGTGSSDRPSIAIADKRSDRLADIANKPACRI
jgi:hypothetical protein